MDVLTLDGYHELRDDYIARNLYLYVFEISAPRTFGEAWAQGHLKELVPELQKPSKKTDPDYSGQYDFFLDNIRIEVKASRAVDADGIGTNSLTVMDFGEKPAVLACQTPALARQAGKGPKEQKHRPPRFHDGQ